MSEPILLDRLKLAMAFSEIEAIRQRLPEDALTGLAQEVVKRVASNWRVSLPHEFEPTSGQIDALCDALLSQDASVAIELIERAQQNGAGYDTLCQSYLAAAARRLGEWWDDDRVSFYKVTIAAGGIYAILRILRLQRPTPIPDSRRSAIFASLPGDNHTLGITVAADLARDRGWDIELFTGLSHDELVHELEQRETGLIGLSASGKRTLPVLMKLIVALRLSNPGARIMVCGQIAALDLNLDGFTGADAAAADFDTAFAYMEQIVSQSRI